MKTYKIKHSNGTLLISANKLRMAIGPDILKSGFVDSITINKKSIIFKGRGWGHGVGMCQWGAKVMADKGYTFRKIINYYFPGTKIERWEE